MEPLTRETFLLAKGQIEKAMEAPTITVPRGMSRECFIEGLHMQDCPKLDCMCICHEWKEPIQ